MARYKKFMFQSLPDTRNLFTTVMLMDAMQYEMTERRGLFSMRAMSTFGVAFGVGEPDLKLRSGLGRPG